MCGKRPLILDGLRANAGFITCRNAAIKRSAKRLRCCKKPGVATKRYQSVTPPTAFGENFPANNPDIDRDQKSNAISSLMCNIQSERLCVRQGFTKVDDQAFSFSN
jgi:hypothetical protein